MTMFSAPQAAAASCPQDSLDPGPEPSAVCQAGPARRPHGSDWLDQIFATRAALSHGVVYRAVRDVEREIGCQTLELEVRRRGFHPLRTDRHFVIVCDSRPLQVIC